MTLAQDPQTGYFYEMALSMKWMAVSKGYGRCRSAKFRWTINWYESLKKSLSKCFTRMDEAFEWSLENEKDEEDEMEQEDWED